MQWQAGGRNDRKLTPGSLQSGNQTKVQVKSSGMSKNQSAKDLTVRLAALWLILQHFSMVHNESGPRSSSLQALSYLPIIQEAD